MALERAWIETAFEQLVTCHSIKHFRSLRGIVAYLTLSCALCLEIPTLNHIAIPSAGPLTAHAHARMSALPPVLIFKSIIDEGLARSSPSSTLVCLDCSCAPSKTAVQAIAPVHTCVGMK
jgi:hypothetical protein